MNTILNRQYKVITSKDGENRALIEVPRFKVQIPNDYVDGLFANGECFIMLC